MIQSFIPFLYMDELGSIKELRLLSLVQGYHSEIWYDDILIRIILKSFHLIGFDFKRLELGLRDLLIIQRHLVIFDLFLIHILVKVFNEDLIIISL